MFNRDGAKIALAAFVAGMATAALAAAFIKRRRIRPEGWSGEQFESLYFAEPRRVAEPARN